MDLLVEAADDAEALGLGNLVLSDMSLAVPNSSPDNATIPNNLPEEVPANVTKCQPACFSLLPTEIQIEIWSLVHEPRAIKIKTRKVDDPTNRKEFLHPGKQACYAVSKLPVELQVCQ